MDQRKACSACAEDKALSEFYQYKGKPQGQCKDCVKARQRAIREGNPLHRPLLPRDEDGKTCPHCKTYKQTEHFRRPISGDVGTYCHPCTKARDREAKRRLADSMKRQARERWAQAVDLTEVRHCPRCDSDKPRAEFAANGKACYCRPCRASYARERNARRRDDERFRRYGYTPEMFADLLEKQGGGCAICGGTEITNGRWTSAHAKDLHVDHDHASGQVRGLLCNRCNMTLGLMDDEPDRLIRAAEYLKNPPAQ